VPVASDDVVWLDVLPSMGRFRSTLQSEAGSAATGAGAAAGSTFTSNFAKHLKVAAVLGTALAVGGAVKFMAEATREASNLGESLNAVKVTFGDNAEGIMRLGRAAAESVGLSQSQFNGLAVQFSAFATTIAGKGGDVVGTMQDLTTRGADFASVMNLDVNEAMGLFQSGLAGETEPLRRYGIDLSAAAVENYALANGIIKSGEEMTEAQKVQARYGSLMEQTSKVQGDFTNTSDSLANSQRILGARWDDIQATVGSKVLPILEKFSGWVLDVALPALGRFGGWFQEHGIPVLQRFGGWITDNVVPALQSFGGWIKDNLLPVAQSLFEKLGAAAAVVFTALVTAFEAVGTAVGAVVGFFQEHDTALNILKGTVAVVGGYIVAAWATQKAVAIASAASSVISWFSVATASTTSATIQSRSTAQIVVGWLAASASAAWNAVKIVAAWTVSVAQTGILMAMYAAQSIAAAATSAGAWLAAQARTVASLIATGAGFVAQGAVMIASMAATAASVVASWVVMGVQSLIQGARMAAAWVLAMGPVGWVIATIVGLVALIIANWDTVVAWTKAAWNALTGAIKAALDWVYNSVIRPILTAIQTAWQAVMDAMAWVWNNILKPAWDAMAAAASWLWNNGLRPVFDFISSAWNTLGRGLRTVYDTVIKPIWDAFTGAINWVKDTFNTAVEGIKTIWNGIKEALRAPVQWVIDLVWNNGLRKLWNAINNLWGGDDIAEFRFSAGGTYTPPPRRPGMQEFASGGVLPGYTPGRDVHQFYSPTGGRLLLSGGEAIMRPEFTRALGTAGIDQLNALARREGVAGLRKVLGGGAVGPGASRGDAPSPQAFAKGGVISLPSWLDPSWFSLLPGGAINTAVLNALLDPINNSGGEGGGQWGGMLWGMVKTTASKVWEKAKELFDSGSGGPIGGGGFMNALRWASTQAGKPYIWGGVGPAGYDCSGFMSAITNVIRGKSPHSRVGATSSFPWSGFRVGMTGPFTIGSSTNTGSGIGHMAGTLNGVNVESRGGEGVVVGPRARGANDRLFHTRAGLFDQGGLWEPGTAGFNLTSGIERVLTPKQDAYFRKFVDLTERREQRAPSGPPVHLYTPDIPHALRALRAEEQQREALAPTW
jgi:hypothetical protein